MRTKLGLLALFLVALVSLDVRTWAEEKYNEDRKDILLQGFHWDSHSGILDPSSGSKKTWYTIMKENSAAIKAAGFTRVWFPPPSDSLSSQETVLTRKPRDAR